MSPTPTPPQPEANTLQWWTVESSPMGGWPGAPALIEQDHHNGRLFLTAAAASMPTDVAARLMSLVDDDFDTGACEANGCGWNGAGKPATPNTVGYALSGDADQYQSWYWATLVRLTDGRVLVVCEECCPDAMYLDSDVPAPPTVVGA